MSGINGRERGFTLVEILVVIGILGVLAAIVIPSVVLFIGEGASEAAGTELQNMLLCVATLRYQSASGSLTGTAIQTWEQDFRGNAIYTITRSGSIARLEDCIETNVTEFWYFIEPNGMISGAYDQAGNEPI